MFLIVQQHILAYIRSITSVWRGIGGSKPRSSGPFCVQNVIEVNVLNIQGSAAAKLKTMFCNVVARKTGRDGHRYS